MCSAGGCAAATAFVCVCSEGVGPSCESSANCAIGWRVRANERSGPLQ